VRAACETGSTKMQAVPGEYETRSSPIEHAIESGVGSEMSRNARRRRNGETRNREAAGSWSDKPVYAAHAIHRFRSQSAGMRDNVNTDIYTPTLQNFALERTFQARRMQRESSGLQTSGEL
jgi:hypothetical protein